MNELEYVDRGSDRLALHVYPDIPDAPMVIIWPAMGTPARFYRHFAAKLHEAGVAVVVADLRGTGSSTPTPSRASRYGYADLADDVGAVLDHLKPRLAGRKRYLLGHSLGGQVCAAHLARNPGEDVDGLILVAVGLPWFRTYPGPRKWGVLGYTQWITGVAATLGVWPGWGFGGRQAAGVIRDWGYTARRGHFPRLAGVDVDAALASVRTPVLAVSVEYDQFTPAGTVDHLCTKLSAAPVERVHLGADGGPRLDHFTWARASDPVVDRVAGFVG